MASMANPGGSPLKSIAPDTFERILALGAIILLGAALTALAKGHSEWRLVPWQVWPHLITILIALALTPIQLLRRRGDPLHRRLGTIWVVAMLATALLSFNVRLINRGEFSLIHLLSAWTLIQAPLIYWSARTHRIRMHRSAVRGMVTGALLIAGAFTFPFNRLLGHWLFG